MVRLGLLGAARIATEAILRPAENQDQLIVTTVASRSPTRASTLARDWGVSRIAASYEALIADPEVDAVYIGLPPSEHKHWAMAALAADKHVLCEKPFAMNAEEAELMERSADRKNLVLMEAFHYRYHPLFAQVVELVESGRLGKINHVSAYFNVPVAYGDREFRYQPRLGGGALMDLGCYPIHWVRTVLGREPRILAADLTRHSSGVDESFEATLSFDENVSGTVAASMREGLPSGIDAKLTVGGERGSLTVENPLAPHQGSRILFKTDFDDLDVSIDGDPTYEYQLRHFLGLLSGRVSRLVPFGDATANMRVIDTIRKISSSQEGY